MNITDIDAKIARSIVICSNSYEYVKNIYMPKIYDAIREASNKGYCVININMIKLLKFKFFKYCFTLLSVTYDQLLSRGFTINIKKNNIIIDWINPRNDDNEEEKEDKSEDSSTGAPRVLESDNEVDEEAIFTPKPIKMKIGF